MVQIKKQNKTNKRSFLNIENNCNGLQLYATYHSCTSQKLISTEKKVIKNEINNNNLCKIWSHCGTNN